MLCFVVWNFWLILRVFFKVGDALKFVNTTLIDNLWKSTVFIEMIYMTINVYFVIDAVINVKLWKSLSATAFFWFIQFIIFFLQFLDFSFETKNFLILFCQDDGIPFWRFIKLCVFDLHLWDAFLFFVNLWLEELNFSQIRFYQWSVRRVIFSQRFSFEKFLDLDFENIFGSAGFVKRDLQFVWLFCLLLVFDDEGFALFLKDGISCFKPRDFFTFTCIHQTFDSVGCIDCKLSHVNAFFAHQLFQLAVFLFQVIDNPS